GGFLALAIAGLIGRDELTVRSVYLATELTTWVVIVPLAFASLLTGLIVAWGTPGGVFRHYWVFVKFMLTILATVLFLLHTSPTHAAARSCSHRCSCGRCLRSRFARAADPTRWRRGCCIARASGQCHALHLQAAGTDVLRPAEKGRRAPGRRTRLGGWRTVPALDAGTRTPRRRSDSPVRNPAPRWRRSGRVAPSIALGSG